MNRPNWTDCPECGGDGFITLTEMTCGHRCPRGTCESPCDSKEETCEVCQGSGSVEIVIDAEEAEAASAGDVFTAALERIAPTKIIDVAAIARRVTAQESAA